MTLPVRYRGKAWCPSCGQGIMERSPLSAAFWLGAVAGSLLTGALTLAVLAA